MGQEMKNPGALAGATGAVNKGGRPTDYESAGHQARRYHSAGRMLRIALTLNANRFTPDGRMEAFEDFANVLHARLTEEERALLAYWSARTLSPPVRWQVVNYAHWGPNWRQGDE